MQKLTCRINSSQIWALTLVPTTRKGTLQMDKRKAINTLIKGERSWKKKRPKDKRKWKGKKGKEKDPVPRISCCFLAESLKKQKNKICHGQIKVAVQHLWTRSTVTLPSRWVKQSNRVTPQLILMPNQQRHEFSPSSLTNDKHGKCTIELHSEWENCNYSVLTVTLKWWRCHQTGMTRFQAQHGSLPSEVLLKQRLGNINIYMSINLAKNSAMSLEDTPVTVSKMRYVYVHDLACRYQAIGVRRVTFLLLVLACILH